MKKTFAALTAVFPGSILIVQLIRYNRAAFVFEWIAAIGVASTVLSMSVTKSDFASITDWANTLAAACLRRL